MIRKVSLFAWSVLLTFVSVATYAQAPSQSEQISDILRIDPDPSQDYMLGWLQSLFGDFILIPWGGSELPTGVESTLLVQAIGFINVIALFLGIVIVVYVGITGVLRTASDGEVLGKNWSSVFLPIRTAIAFFSITPVISVGGGVLSMIQVLIISLILIGSNAATFLWDFVAERITDGSPLIASHSGSVGMQPGKDLLASLVCAQSIYLYEQNTGRQNQPVARLEHDPQVVGFGGTAGVIQGPVDEANFSIPPYVSELHFGSEGQCGSVRFPNQIQGTDKTYHQIAIDEASLAAKSTVTAALNELSSIAAMIVGGVSEGGLGGGANIEAILRSDSDEDKQDLEQVARAYGQISESLGSSLYTNIQQASIGNPEVTSLWKDDVTQGGWGAAGLWFFEISRFQTISESLLSQVTSSISTPQPPEFCGKFQRWYAFWKDCADYAEIVSLDMTAGVDAIHSIAVAERANEGLSASQQLEATLDEMDARKIDQSIFGNLSANGAQKVLDVLSSPDNYLRRMDTNIPGMAGVNENQNGLTSPFATVVGIGSTLNSTAVTAWTAGLVAAIASGGFENTNVPILSTGTGAIGGGLRWIGTTLAAFAMVIVPMGFVLAFLIPFMPIIVWTRLLASYILTVIEAVVAFPLAVIMMATPEGEGISGTRLERAIQLLAAVILKPTLLIIGLVAALAISFISFAILNFFFWRASGVLTGAGPLEFIAIMVIYTGAAFQVAKASIMIMHKLGDQILDWMAGGVGGRSFGDDAEGAIESGLGQANSGLGSVSQSLSQSASRPPRGNPEG